jgi:DNA-binding transcriptional MerR regulator
METREFLNREVSKITGLAQRQVLSWTEKGLIIPHKEATGTGTKRVYGYINLLEFALCKELFQVGLGFQGTKKIISDLRNGDILSNWALDFEQYYKNMFLLQKMKIGELFRNLDQEPNPLLAKIPKDFEERFLSKPYEPESPIGVLIYFFNKGKNRFHVIPWDMLYTLNLNIIKDGFTESTSAIIVDLGKIKSEIDRSL